MSTDIVSTNLGKVKGRTFELKDGKPVHVYRNIPYAKPPTGPLRFMAPVPADPWNDVKDGIVTGNKPCFIEGMEEMLEKIFPFVPLAVKPVCDEDCLHVTVYTPYPIKGKNLPVMVWFYGGGFQMGSESLYDGGVLAGMNDVVVVIPNYRVGVFGFFSMGPDSCCPGNAGILDQQQSLRWIQDNIEYFGGDKNNVTIFGESAGGVAVELNLLSPPARGLFHKAISHSGQALLAEIPRIHNATLLERSKELLAKQLKLETLDGPELLEALQTVSAKEMLDATTGLFEHEAYFAPYADGRIIPKEVREMLNGKDFGKIPYIIGCNSTEGFGLLVQFPGYDDGITEADAKTKIFIKMNDEGFEKCKQKYLREENGERKFSVLHSKIVQDGGFISTAVHSAIRHTEAGADVYFYLGDFQLRMHHDNEFGREVTKKGDWCRCDHGDEIFMTFGVPFSPKELPHGAKFSKEEEEISRSFMTYLTNFARTGDPNKGKDVKVKWPKYQPMGEHLVVSSPFSTGKNFGEDAVKFWIEDMAPYRI